MCKFPLYVLLSHLFCGRITLQVLVILPPACRPCLLISMLVSSWWDPQLQDKFMVVAPTTCSIKFYSVAMSRPQVLPVRFPGVYLASVRSRFHQKISSLHSFLFHQGQKNALILQDNSSSSSCNRILLSWRSPYISFIVVSLLAITLLPLFFKTNMCLN